MTADGGPASSLRSDPALQALDAIHLAAVVLDVRAVVVHCNHFANRILAADFFGNTHM